MAKPGYEVASDHLRTYAGALGKDGTRCQNLKASVPKFSGADYVPGYGLPITGGIFFAGDYNETADMFKDALKALGDALTAAEGKLNTVANTYEQVEKQAAANAGKAGNP